MVEAVSHRHHWPADGCCANCGTGLLGNWCHSCGQRAHDHHRSLRHLGAEAIESLTHADGRLWHTLRLLTLRPATLTRDYVAGKRAAEIPPLRLFFVVLLLVFATGSLFHGYHVHTRTFLKLRAPDGNIGVTLTGWPRLSAWLELHLTRASNNPDVLLTIMGEWAERFAVLLLPLSALSLKLLFPLRRDMKLYDHMVFTMHSLSFAGLAWVLDQATKPVRYLGDTVNFALLFLVPTHLFLHMRGFYRIGVFGTLVRMGLLAVMTLGMFAFLLAALAAVSISLVPG